MTQGAERRQPRHPPVQPSLAQTDAPQQEQCPSNAGQCGFSREELEQILKERNELKANVFLLKEELAYFQR